MGNILETIVDKLLILPGILIGLSFHEFAHAYAAYKCGDDTAKMLGRLDINPLKHIDPIGFLMLLIVGWGWAKPVPINPNNFHKRRRDYLIVSLAGVTMNLVLATFFMFLLVLIQKLGVTNVATIAVIYGAASINIVLMIFNLLPIPPLDGFSVLETIFWGKTHGLKESLSKYGMIILLVLVFSGRLVAVLIPIHDFFFNNIFLFFRSILGM